MAEKMIIPEDYVAIPVDEYAELIESRSNLDIFCNALYGGARLSWDKKSLQFNDSDLNAVLKAVNTGMYSRHLMNLQKEYEAREEELKRRILEREEEAKRHILEEESNGTD